MSSFDVEVQIKTEFPSPPGPVVVRKQVRRVAASTLEEAGSPQESGLSIMLTGDQAIRTLNREFRQMDRPTDVLSFPAELGVPGMDGYLGDIAISIPRAQAQANAAGHSLLDELALLTVHGVLHLLGHDHDNPMEQGAMWAVQDRVLASLNVAARSPDFEAGG